MKFEELTDDQKAKVQACKTPEDVIALAQTEGYELSDEELEAISAGSSWWEYPGEGPCPFI